MNFKKIAIVGLGLIGGSLAAALKRKKLAVKIIGIDHKDVIDKALSQGLINQGYELNLIDKALEEAELIILATPIKGILELLSTIGDIIKNAALVTDVGSTKDEIVYAAHKYLPDGVHFLGGHPMTGAEKSGLDNADPFLFENAVYILTENQSVPIELVEKLVNTLEAVGAKIIFLPAKLHDEIAAVVSHLPQILAVTLMQYASRLNLDNSVYLKLAAGGFRDMTRVASSPYAVWADILKSNKENIVSTIEQFIDELTTVKEMLLIPGKMESLFAKAAKNRLSIPKDTRGFLKPQYDISVVVEDTPGVFASISSTLFNEKINIKDVEVLKIREGDGGTMRLAFESETDRERAIAHLLNIGFQVSKRGE